MRVGAVRPGGERGSRGERARAGRWEGVAVEGGGGQADGGEGVEERRAEVRSGVEAFA